ncbi:MAG: replicative DNA helicase [Candidatus Tectomicrobia bacterium]|uniref:DNA 5'-3' helicase n=1 Tax=Tectimicrobiota bacterium TaxID=2528274 RepID=A0A932LZB0_UNCTE|nr:replicative DNA helicase [Candidatus Tectomicrobia bacterium]
METAIHRLPPQNLEAEQCVLGAILRENEALSRVLDILQEDQFYSGAHRKIFQAMLDLFERGEPIDLLTLQERLRARGELEVVGGVAYLASLTDMIPTAANVRFHSMIVREKYVVRSLIQSATEIVTQSYEESEDVDVLLDRAERAIFEISERRIQPAFVSLDQVVKESLRHIESLYDRKELVTGVPTGFKDLDERTAGFQPSDLIVIAGRPSMGKTSFSLNIARYVAVEAKLPVAVFSLEMSKEQLGIRLLCSDARVNSTSVRTGFLRKEEHTALARAAAALYEAPIFIDDSPALSVLNIRAKARGREIENRTQEISMISRSLKALARELRCPVVALSQLSRNVESRTDKRPMLSDLRESGAIEQDADVVMFLYREEVYTEEKPGTAEVIIGKQRNGPTGSFDLVFLKEYTRFENLAKGYDD